MSKAHVVLIVGAWHRPSCFSLITTELESHGYTVHAPDLPSVTDTNATKDLSGDIAVVQDTVTKAIGTGNDVVVVGHSWGGMVITSALVGFGKKTREERGESGGVIKVGYMTAFMPRDGASLLDMLAGGPPPDPAWFDIEGEYSTLNANAAYTLYNDLPPEDRARWLSAACPKHSFSSWTSPTTGLAYLEIPSSYLLCEADLAIPIQGQEAMVEGARSAGAQVETERLEGCGHSPFLSRVGETVGWIRRMAGESV